VPTVSAVVLGADEESNEPRTTATPTSAPPTTAAAAITGQPVDEIPDASGAPLTGNPFAESIGEWVAGDLPRVHPLPDGRQIWWLNDSFLPANGRGPVDQFVMVRNVAFVRGLDGELELLAGGAQGARREFLEHPEPDRFRRFYWPLGGEVDGPHLKIVVAEMECTQPHWGICFRPVSTQLATYRWDDMTLVSMEPAPNPGVRPIYGFSVASDDEWSYLFGNGHEYNTPDDWGGSTQTFVARVPRGKLELAPEYWDGTSWNTDPAAAVPLVQRGYADFRMSVVRWGDRWIGTAKEDEFVGRRIIVMEAPAPQGPWQDLAWIPMAPPEGVPDGVTYDAIPYPEPVDGRLAIFYSVNSMTERVVFADPSMYRPALLLTELG
jgi:hypothetical protein